MKKLIIMSLMLLTILSCRKDDEAVDILEPIPNPTIFNIDGYEPKQIDVTATIWGSVTNESGDFIEGVTAKIGNNTVTTDKKGRFLLKDIQMNAAGTYLEINQLGYFPGSHRFYPKNGSVNTTQIVLLEKASTGNFTAETGGLVTNTEGVELNFPANAIVTESGDTYSGTVNVSARYINPIADEVSLIMPGNLFALDATGTEVILVSFGMGAIELTGSGGEVLNLGNEAKATLSMLVPASILNEAPAEIPLWYFNETYGIWVEEGKASLQGNKYVGEVSHFSFWSCDDPFDLVDFTVKVLNEDGMPLEYVGVQLKTLDNLEMGYGYTDADGIVSGKVIKDVEFEMRSFLYFNGCSIFDFYSFDVVGPFADDTDIGDIFIDNTPVGLVEVQASVVDCEGDPLTSGYIEIDWGNDGGIDHSVYVENGNDIDILVYNCSNSQEMSVVATNLIDFEESDPFTFTVTDPLDLGEIAACGNSNDEYLTVEVDGISTTFINVSAGTIVDSTYFGGFIPGLSNNFSISLIGTEVGVYGNEDIYYSYGSLETTSGPEFMQFDCWNSSGQWNCGYENIEITEMGDVGEKVEGTFSGTLEFYDPNISDNVSHLVTGSFSIYRDY